MSEIFSIKGNPKFIGNGGGGCGAVLYPDTMFEPQGWVCPKCGRVYSPFQPMCLYCGNEKVVYTTDTNTATINEGYTGNGGEGRNIVFDFEGGRGK